MEPANINQIRNSMQMGSALRAQNIRKTDTEANQQKVQQDDRAQESARNQENAGRTAAQAEDAAAKGIYGEVLDISEDGDTVTARPEALQKLDDGIVMLRSDSSEEKQEVIEMQKESTERREEIAEALEAKAEASREAREEVRKENQKEESEAAEEADTTRINSLNGYSDNMIDTLYRQGKIDRSEYNSELDRRARLDEQLNPTEDETNDQRIENGEAFNRQMGELNAEADEDTRESEALITAAENGRVDLMKDIFNNTIN